MRHQSLLVFDIETIPDVSCVKGLLGDVENETIQQAQERLKNYHLESTGGKNDFLRQIFHHVVMISCLQCDINYDQGYERYVFKKLGSFGDTDQLMDEQELVDKFFSYCQKIKPRFVSYNGRGFDFPVLKYRAMKHDIESAAWLHDVTNKWENYTVRYAPKWHCDLVEVLSDYGASARSKLDEICSVFGFPGKGDVNGGDVHQLVEDQDYEKLMHYCETDVLNTYFVYLKYALHVGMTCGQFYHDAMVDMGVFVKENKDKSDVYRDFYSALERNDFYSKFS